MDYLGEIVRLQAQRESLKAGQKPHRYYDPTPITVVPQLTLDAGGVTGHDHDGAPIADVHHRDHPASRYTDGNGVLLGFTAHYDAMRARFGAHVTDGLAGENILVQCGRVVHEDDLACGLLIVTAEGRDLTLRGATAAEPCVEFSRHVLRYPREARSDATVTAALAFLRHGMRGYYLTYDGAPTRIHVGDRVWACTSDS